MANDFSDILSGTVSPEDLARQILTQDLNSTELLRAAVENPQLASTLEALAKDWLASTDVRLVARAIFFVEGLGLRTAVPHILHIIESGALHCHQAFPDGLELEPSGLRMSPSPGLRQPGTFRGYSIAQVMADVGLNLAVRGRGDREALLMATLRHPDLCSFSWKHLEGAHLADAVPFISVLLGVHPQLASEVATRYAILSPDSLLELIPHLGPVQRGARDAFAQAARKNLLRTGKVRIWALSQRALKTLSADV